MDPHLTDEELVTLAEGSASPALWERAHQHADQCSDCHRLLAEVMVRETGVQDSLDASIARAEAPTRWEPPAQVDQFRIQELMGSGTFGQVYRAWDSRLHRPVALKFLNAFENSAARKSFTNESRGQARLTHPNVATLYDSGEFQGRFYLVSELLSGTTLDRVPRPLAPAEVVRIGIDVARGLAEAHRRGVYHRDIKPANLMRTEEGTVKILDFGLAKLFDQIESVRAASISTGETEAQGSTMVGTPLYMAPEIWRGEVASERADVYALGAVLYELSCGQPPHVADTLAEMRRLALTVDARPLTSVAPAVPRALGALVDSCVRRNAAQRPATARDVLLRLQEVAHSMEQGLPLPLPLLALCCGLVLGAMGYWVLKGKGPVTPAPLATPGPSERAMTGPPPAYVSLPGGVFRVGSSDLDLERYYKDALPEMRKLGLELGLEAYLQRFHSEGPPHLVRLSPYRMASAEVTTREFADWLNKKAGALTVRMRRLQEAVTPDPYLYLGEEPLVDLISMPSPGFGLELAATEDRFVAAAGKEDLPISQVTWFAALRYCLDQGQRLPTEAEWEAAARGAARRDFPWGTQIPDECDQVAWRRRAYDENVDVCEGPAPPLGAPMTLAEWRQRQSGATSPRPEEDAALRCPPEQLKQKRQTLRREHCADSGDRFLPVRTAKMDVTPEGIYDLAGNVSEWVLDGFSFYLADVPGQPPPQDPVVLPGKLPKRVARGGDTGTVPSYARGAARSAYFADQGPLRVGFRCAVRANGGEDPLVRELLQKLPRR